MTHSIDAPFPPPPTTSGTASGATSGGGTPSTGDVTRDEARNVGQTAAQAGSQVASTATDQAKEVVHETRRQASDLLDQGRSQIREQAVSQQQKAAQGLSSLVEELRSMLNGSGTSTSGPAHDLLDQATGKLDELAGWLQNREPADLLDEVRTFARRKPGTFLLGAALAGVVAGRLTSGVKAVHRDSGSSGGQHRSADTGYTRANYVDPSPTYSTGYVDSGYTGTTTGTGGYTGTTTGGYGETAGYPETVSPGTGTPLPPPPYGTVPPAGSVVPPTTPAGWDDPTRRPGEGGADR